MFVTLLSQAQENTGLMKMRSEFQEISSEADIKKFLDFEYENTDVNEIQLIEAYQATATCMLANYVFSPVSKLKYFNEGKEKLEELILARKGVENVYLRLLLQLKVPQILSYYKNIEEDVAYLESSLAAAPIELSYKYAMIKNLVSLAKKNELKEVLLQINVVEEG
jgi:hypothetical protein